MSAKGAACNKESIEISEKTAAALVDEELLAYLLPEKQRDCAKDCSQIIPAALDKLRSLRPLCVYVWWKKPAEALAMPNLLIAQVMEFGTFEDVRLLVDTVGEDPLRLVLKHAAPGQFSPRSWHYWHYRLKCAELGCVPPLPSRKFDE